MKFVYNDGGRAAAGYKGSTSDCVVRAIAIATELPYQQVYDLVNELAQRERTGKRKRGKSNARTGVYKDTIKRVMERLGWRWIPTMHIGSGCKVHLTDGELPMGRLVVNVSKHTTAVIDGVIHDTHDPQRAPETTTWFKAGTTEVSHTTTSGGRCVYGYYVKA